MSNEFDDDYTTAELLGMDDEEFADAVTEDLAWTKASESPFQDAEVIRRTIAALVSKIHFADATLDRQAEDPEVSAKRFDGTASFRRHLIAVLDISETRLYWQEKRYAGATREARAWKALLNRVCDAIENTNLDDILDDLTIPMRDDADPKIDLRTWIAVRRAKDPSRAPQKEDAA